jgi:oxygen-independent coproporphyrinogen-3 oxidase
VKENYAHYFDLPDEEWIEKEYYDVSEFLRSNSFNHYEVSNFALPNKQSQHNLNYWRSQTVAALGPSATGFLKKEKLRYKWKANQPEFEIEMLSDNEFRLEEVYMSLRSEEGIRIADFPSAILSLIETWKKQNVVQEFNGIVRLTPRGYLLIDSLMNVLFITKLL